MFKTYQVTIHLQFLTTNITDLKYLNYIALIILENCLLYFLKLWFFKILSFLNSNQNPIFSCVVSFVSAQMEFTPRKWKFCEKNKYISI